MRTKRNENYIQNLCMVLLNIQIHNKKLTAFAIDLISVAEYGLIIILIEFAIMGNTPICTKSIFTDDRVKASCSKDELYLVALGNTSDETKEQESDDDHCNRLHSKQRLKKGVIFLVVSSRT